MSSPSIESLGYPLVYKAEVEAAPPAGLPERDIPLRTKVRALEGMQKEALVYDGQTETVWRMVSDEGPYLNGTDLAPFPLAFYTTGMALSFTEAFLRHAAAADVIINDYKLTQDNFYTMEGSAIRGDMVGGALPVKMVVEIETAAPAEVVQTLVALAEQTSPPQCYMTERLQNRFALVHNGEAVELADMPPVPQRSPVEPTTAFETAAPLEADSYQAEIITKLAAAETLFGVEGGAGSSLQATQKRTLHVRGVCTLRDDGLQEVLVQLFKPIGSNFRFLSDGRGQRAPSSLPFLAAGVGFCFMTQIGRYAHIVKQDLQAYSIVQDTVYSIGGETAAAEPVETHVYLTSGETEEAAQKTVFMSERTCFLHAAMRSSNKTEVALKVNGKAVLRL